MKLITNIQRYQSKTGAHKKAIVMCGFGGAIWQTRRLTMVLRKAGYDVVAVDFSKEVLGSGDPTFLPRLVEETLAFTEEEARKHDDEVMLIGISLGALMALNILRRSPLFTRGVLITGGNIVTVAQNIYGSKIWPQSHAALSELWESVNIHTDPERLRGKKMLFVLPAKDTLIDTTEVREEITRQNAAGNHIALVERGQFGHIGTIIQETVLFPRRILRYIAAISG
jgi:pimeloyl-ACP methyl ester carboxylesterase